MVEIQPKDIILSDIRNNEQGRVQFTMYVLVTGRSTVLNIEDLQEAVEVKLIKDFK